ncbi:hypothetical protein [Salinispora cortesiana]|uniref:hypothetical protein n=1 Tax=Salinispora cortesiana TaxID=1305843 RepID=UPI0012BB81F7|nr:hypothetical protein [Salinispora cortesiana]
MTEYADLADLLVDWLLHSPIQLANGQHQGAVAGWLGDHDQPTFAYPEITGYYLSTMSYISYTRPDLADAANSAAGRALDWIRKATVAGQVVPTRIHLDGYAANHDWRNRARFSFDLGMILRGVISAGATFTHPLTDDLRLTICSMIRPFCSPAGPIASHQVNPGFDDSCLPPRWSTQKGPHHVKVAAGLSVVPEDDFLRSSGRATIEYWAGHDDDLSGVQPHPAFYYIEGMLQAAKIYASERYLDVATSRYGRTLERLRGESGAIDLSRSDVLAQALRIGCHLAAVGRLSAKYEDCLSELAKSYCRFVRSDGSVLFRQDSPGITVQRNAWSAMFGLQALDLYRGLLVGDARINSIALLHLI